MLLDLTIPGEPYPAPRPRATIRGGRPAVYMPTAYEAELARVNLRAHTAGGWRYQPAHQGPVAVEITAWHACPKSDERKRTPAPERWWCGGSHDVDNLAKTYLDALMAGGKRRRARVAVLADDGQVVDLHVRKMIAAQGEPARVRVVVSAVEGAP